MFFEPEQRMTQAFMKRAVVGIIEQGVGKEDQRRQRALLPQKAVAHGQQRLPSNAQQLLSTQPPGLRLRQWPEALGIQAGPQPLAQQRVGPAQGLEGHHKTAVQGQAHGLQIGPGFAASRRHRTTIGSAQPHLLHGQAPAPQLGAIGGEAVEMAADLGQRRRRHDG